MLDKILLSSKTYKALFLGGGLFFCILLLFQGCCNTPCNEFCEGFELNLDFQKDSTQTGYFTKAEIDSIRVVRYRTGAATDVSRLPANGQFRFTTIAPANEFRFVFYLPSDSAKQSFLIENLAPQKTGVSNCCKCGELSSIDFTLNGIPVNVRRSKAHTITKK